MGRRRGDRVSVVEAAYADVASDKEWLQGLARSAEPEMAEGFGTCAYTYDVSQAHMRIGDFVGHNLPFPVELLVNTIGNADDAYIEQSYRKLSFALASQIV